MIREKFLAGNAAFKVRTCSCSLSVERLLVSMIRERNVETLIKRRRGACSTAVLQSTRCWWAQPWVVDLVAAGAAALSPSSRRYSRSLAAPYPERFLTKQNFHEVNLSFPWESSKWESFSLLRAMN